MIRTGELSAMVKSDYFETFLFSALYHLSCPRANDDSQLLQSSHFYSLQNRESEVPHAETRSGAHHYTPL
jgi:hypothetical protein